MKVIGRLERSNQNNRVLQAGKGKIRYHIWFWLLIISFLMLFYMGTCHTYIVQGQQTQSNQKHREGMSQASNLESAATRGLIYKSEIDLFAWKENSDKPIFLGILFFLLVYLGAYFGNYKVQWLNYVFFPGFLDKLIQYIYLSDGKKRILVIA